MVKRLLLRTDASSFIGAGHVMRCLTLADALSEQGVICHFICAAEEGHLQELIRLLGYQVFSVEPVQDEIQHARQCLAQLFHNYDLLIVDHYQLSASFEHLMRPMCEQVMVIDDLANRPHDCDILLDQNLLLDVDERYLGLVSKECECLLGPEFCLLRPEFIQTPKANTSKNQRLMVSLGGSDPANHSRKVLQAIELLNWQVPVDLVLGGKSPWNQQLQQEFGHLSQIQWHIQCDTMAQLMSHAKLAIGTGGSSHWERCMLGLPALVMTVADNQIPTTELLAQLGVCNYLGKAEQISVEQLAHNLLHAWQDDDKLTLMADTAYSLIGADGCNKVVERILAN